MNHISIKTIEIRKVSGKRDLDAFIRVPWEIYKDDPNWVAPLLIERKEALSDKNPWFEHAEWCAWIAYRDSKPVGRISAQIDQLHQQRYDNQTGFFGLIEAMDDNEIFKALFETAETWLREKGMRQILGPFNLGINQEIGILVEGFDTPPSVMMPHSRAYYDSAIKDCGYQSAQDLLAYEFQADKISIPKVMRRLVGSGAKRINVRSLRGSEKETELEVMRDIFNDAWENNWNFVPFTQNEFKAVGKELLMLLPSDYIQIAEVDGEAAAFIAAIPNINEAIADLNGRLLPFGWAKLLWRLKVASPKSARVALMGVRQKYQNTRLGPTLAYKVMSAAIEAGNSRGVKRVELSWILEQNRGMRHIIEGLNGKITKRYRMYEKKL